MSHFQIGWAEYSLTPDKKVSLVGQFAERISEYVEKPLCVTAMAVSTDSDQAVFCSCDLVGVSWSLRDAVREKLAGNTVGLDPMKVIISAIHTHTGPGYTGRGNSSGRFSSNSSGFRALLESELPAGKKYVESANVTANPEIAQDDELLEFLSGQIAKAALEAWAKRAPGGFSNAFGRAVVGMCRRVCYNDGSAQMWGNAETAKFTEIEGGNDSGIELMYVFNEKNELTGIVANLACPAQCVQHRLFVSPRLLGRGQDAPASAFRRAHLPAAAVLRRGRPVPGRPRPLGRARKRRARSEPQAHQPAQAQGRSVDVRPVRHAQGRQAHCKRDH